MYSFEEMERDPNLATMARGGTVFYPSFYQGILGGNLGGFVFQPVSLKRIF